MVAAIELLDAEAAARRRDGLAAVLVDAVAGGASVSFMAPFGPEAAETEALRHGKTLIVLDTASDAAERLYEGIGYVRVGAIPDYALFPDGRPCATTIYYKRLA